MRGSRRAGRVLAACRARTTRASSATASRACAWRGRRPRLRAARRSRGARARGARGAALPRARLPRRGGAARWPSPHPAWEEIFCGGIAAQLAPHLRTAAPRSIRGWPPLIDRDARGGRPSTSQRWFDRLAWWQHPRAPLRAVGPAPDADASPVTPFSVGVDHPAEVAGSAVAPLRLDAVHVPLQPDRPSGGVRPVRLHPRRPARRPPDRRPPLRRRDGAARGGGVRAPGALGERAAARLSAATAGRARRRRRAAVSLRRRLLPATLTRAPARGSVSSCARGALPPETSLGELLVALAVLALALAMAFGALRAGLGVYAWGAARVEAQQSARAALDRMARELRGAGFDASASGLAPLVAAAPSSVTFQRADTAAPGAAARVTYLLRAGETVLRRDAGAGAQPIAETCAASRSRLLRPRGRPHERSRARRRRCASSSRSAPPVPSR